MPLSTRFFGFIVRGFKYSFVIISSCLHFLKDHHLFYCVCSLKNEISYQLRAGFLVNGSNLDQMAHFLQAQWSQSSFHPDCGPICLLRVLHRPHHLFQMNHFYLNHLSFTLLKHYQDRQKTIHFFLQLLRQQRGAEQRRGCPHASGRQSQASFRLLDQRAVQCRRLFS